MAKSLRTGFVFEEIFLWHDTGTAAGILPAGLTIEPGEHAESSATKRRFRSLLAVSGLLEKLVPISARPVDRAYLLRFHDEAYVTRIETASATAGGDAGEITPFGRGSYDIALLAAGGTRQAMEAVLSGKVDNAYALVRPPGHHAERDQGRGFCLFANVALAVMHAQAELGVGRVAVVDWDVHHGNGTEQAFYDNPDVLTISLHQDNFYPHDSGHREHNGAGAGEGYNLNIPLPPGSGIGAYAAAFDQVVVPALRRFKPELIFIASGFDGSGIDPLGRMLLNSDNYRQLTRKLMTAADELCGGRLVFSHEGGYSASLTPYCGLAVMEELSGIKTAIGAPFLPIMLNWGWQELQPHQRVAIKKAAALLYKIA